MVQRVRKGAGTYEYQCRLPGGLPLLGRDSDRRTLFNSFNTIERVKKRKEKARTNKLAVAHDRKVKVDLHRFCMVRRAPTHQLVTRVRNEGVPTRVPTAVFKIPLLVADESNRTP